MEQADLCMGCMGSKSDDQTCSQCGFVEGTEPDSPLFMPPRTLLENKYLIGRVLGQGGFGITYLAWDLNLNVKLAIKEYFPQDLASRAAGHNQVSAYSGSMGGQYDYGLDKFLQEARTLAQFEGHPNIVSVRDFFKANGTAYFVMSYVEGITLKDHLANSGGVLPAEQARGILMPVMDALKEVHDVKILHRDISPDNIFINRKGQVILIDFGAARQAIGEKGRSLSIILKPGYAPEEQYRSKGVQGPWTDIYAIAATYYHLITGHQPPEALERLVDDPLEPPTKLGALLNENEEKALLKALAVRAGDRFQTIEEFQVAILGEKPENAIYGQVFQTGIGQSSNLVATEEKRKLPVIVIAAAVAALILIAGGVMAFDYFSPGGKEQATDNPELIEMDSTPENNVESDLTDVSGLEEQEEDPEEEEPEIKNEEEFLPDPETEPEPEPIPQPDPTPEPAPDPTPDPEPAPAPSDSGQVENMSFEGGVYSGAVKDGKPHGQGQWNHPNGLKYVGQFTNGNVTGSGTLSLPNGDVYTGSLVKGVPNGQGKMVTVGGAVQEGIWVNGTLQ